MKEKEKSIEFPKSALFGMKFHCNQLQLASKTRYEKPISDVVPLFAMEHIWRTIVDDQTRKSESKYLRRKTTDQYLWDINWKLKLRRELE